MLELIVPLAFIALAGVIWAVARHLDRRDNWPLAPDEWDKPKAGDWQWPSR